MTKKKKDANEMTTEELAKRVFPKKVREEIQRIAHEGEDKEENEASNSSRE